MNLATLAWRNLRNRWARTAATIAGITLAVASFVTLVGLARGIESTMLAALQVRGTDVIVTEAGALDLLSSIIPDAAAADFARLDGVGDAAPELSRLTALANGGSAMVVSWPGEAYPWATLDLVSGRLPGPDDREVVVVGASLARRYDLAVGGSLELFQTRFEIIGEIDSTSALTRNLVFVLLADAQRLTFRMGKATSLNLRLDAGLAPEARRAVVERLRREQPGYAIDETRALVENYTFTRIARVLSFSISAVALASAILVIFNTMTMAVNERRGELAIMSAVGWSRRQTILSILIEGALLALCAGLLGSGLGLGAAHLVVLVPSVAGYIEPEISAALLLGAVGLSLGIGIAGSLLPALQATARSPAEILRGR